MTIKPFSIPISVVGPGSHQEEVTAHTIGVPDSVETFHMPSVPEVSDRKAALDCRQFFIDLYNAMLSWNINSGEPGPALAVNGYSPATLALINQMLGEGEVAIRIQIPNKHFDEIRVQESVFVGIWRVRYFHKNVAIADQLEVSALPSCVAEAAYTLTQPQLNKVNVTPEAMNSPAILAEIKQSLSKWDPGSAPITINLSHLPMTPADAKIIDEAVGNGAIHMVSRGLGNCHILSTNVRHIWKIQYFNNAPMSRMILNTISICGIPEEAIASSEDLQDSIERIKELIEWITKSWDLPPTSHLF
ncbi:MAG: hydrogenase [Burkholderiaceae bacterium]|nr:hydrogenase [Burkholderiaceae bacterium]